MLLFLFLMINNKKDIKINKQSAKRKDCIPTTQRSVRSVPLPHSTFTLSSHRAPLKLKMATTSARRSLLGVPLLPENKGHFCDTAHKITQ